MLQGVSAEQVIRLHIIRDLHVDEGVAGRPGLQGVPEELPVLRTAATLTLPLVGLYSPYSVAIALVATPASQQYTDALCAAATGRAFDLLDEVDAGLSSQGVVIACAVVAQPVPVNEEEPTWDGLHLAVGHGDLLRCCRNDRCEAVHGSSPLMYRSRRSSCGIVKSLFLAFARKLMTRTLPGMYPNAGSTLSSDGEESVGLPSPCASCIPRIGQVAGIGTSAAVMVHGYPPFLARERAFRTRAWAGSASRLRACAAAPFSLSYVSAFRLVEHGRHHELANACRLGANMPTSEHPHLLQTGIKQCLPVRHQPPRLPAPGPWLGQRVPRPRLPVRGRTQRPGCRCSARWQTAGRGSGSPGSSSPA
jgi:hypothetical protein